MLKRKPKKQTKYTILAKCYDKKDRLLSVGVNSYRKTHPLMQLFAKLAGQQQRIFLHAEVLALLRAKDNEVHTLTVERYDSKGQMQLAKPCKVCQQAIEYFGVKQVTYTDTNGWVSYLVDQEE